MKHLHLTLIVAILLALVSILPAVAQDGIPVVDFVFDGAELQKLEDGVVVQAWTMPISLDTQQTIAALTARVQTDDPDVRTVFDDDRMYHLRGNQIVDLWLLRGGQWVEVPVLDVQYVYNGRQLQRFVNGDIQQAWTMPIGPETQQVMMVMQAEANKIVAGHMYEELYIDQAIEHVPELMADDFALHYIPLDDAPDMTWYTPEIAGVFTSVLADPINEPVVLATEDLVITQHPASAAVFDLLDIPPIADEDVAGLYDLYRIRDGKVTDLWLGYDLPELINGG